MPVVNISKQCDSFCVSNKFVDKFMCDANGSYVKVYLYCLRCAEGGEALSMSKIASTLNMIQSDVISALKYWDSVGVVKFEKNDNGDYTLVISDSFEEKKQEITYTEDVSGEKKISTGNISYSRSDITTAMHGNEKVRQLFTLSSQLLAKTLNNNDMNIIYMFYDYLKLPPEVIFSLLEYCMSIGKTNMRYIEKVALSWADEEINTVAKASAYIRAKNKENAFIQKYKTMFKIVGRDMTESEIGLLKTWVNDYKLTDEMLTEVYETTVMNTGKVAFRYMDTVIKNKLSGADDAKKPKQKKNAFQDYGSDGYEYDLAMTLEEISSKS